MEAACPDAVCELPMQVRFDSQGGDHQQTSEREVDAWIDKVRGLVR